jgi:energy-coupling factor transporter ATP-binding protein EcfA2
MKILSIQLKGIRGLANTTISFERSRTGLPHEVVVLTGKPSSGKTSLLRAIAAAKEGAGSVGAPPSSTSILDNDTSTGHLGASWCLTDDERRAANAASSVCRTVWSVGRDVVAQVDPALRLVYAGHGHSPPQSKLEWVPASRRLVAHRTAMLPAAHSDGAEVVKRARDDPDKYNTLLRALRDAVVQEAEGVARLLSDKGIALRSQVPDALAAAKVNVGSMCPDLRLVAVEPRGDHRPLVWFQTRVGKRVELEGLSDGERQGLLFALLFATLELHHSIILIDTPELCIHPADHVRFFRAICDLGTSNQIIAATTSPAILSSVAPEQVIDLSKLMETAV